MLVKSAPDINHGYHLCQGFRDNAHSHENGSSSGFFVLWSNNPCSLHKICNRVDFLLDLDKIYTDIYSFLYFWLQIHTTFAPQRPKNT